MTPRELLADDGLDRLIMRLLLAHSSSDRARRAAAAWLVAFETALAGGSAAATAHVQAHAALERALERESGVLDEGSVMLAPRYERPCPRAAASARAPPRWG